MLLEVDGTPVFAKLLALTALERQPEHAGSTANLYDLPMACHYGVASPGFGAWRELEANRIVTDRALAGRTAAFPLLLHGRALDLPSGPLADELADIDAFVALWHGSPAVRRRVEALAEAPASLVLCFEYRPTPLERWLQERIEAGDADAAITQVDRQLRAAFGLLGDVGLFHFDAHFGNLLIDDGELLIADLGLATSRTFALSPAESAFLDANRTHDVAHVLTRLVDWVVSRFTDAVHWHPRNELIRACADGAPLPASLPPGAATLVRRYAGVAVLLNDFYFQLHGHDPTAQYPTEAVGRACAHAGLPTR